MRFSWPSLLLRILKKSRGVFARRIMRSCCALSITQIPDSRVGPSHKHTIKTQQQMFVYLFTRTQQLHKYAELLLHLLVSPLKGKHLSSAANQPPICILMTRRSFPEPLLLPPPVSVPPPSPGPVRPPASPPTPPTHRYVAAPSCWRGPAGRSVVQTSLRCSFQRWK